jgi:type IV pilus assembly protein PilC
MIDFAYTDKDKAADKEVKGRIQADNEQAAANILIGKKLYPISITPAAGTGLNRSIQLFNKVSAKNRVIFTRQLATLVKAGLPISQALNTSIEQVSDKNFQQTLQKVAASVEGGTSLADSFGQYPEIFNHVYVSLVHAGEESGTLDDALERLADQQEKEQQIVSKIRGALIYPALVLGTIIAVVIFMFVSVLPQIVGLYDELKKPLPWLTQIMFAITQAMINYWYVFLLLFVAIIFGTRAYIKTPNGRANFDRLKMNVPIFGKLFKKVYMARFSRTLASLVNSGVPLLEALSISSDAVNNVVLKTEITDAASQVKNGTSLSKSLADAKHFLPLVPQMIKVGEESGALGGMLDKVASFYEDEVDQTVKNLSTVIEPVMMIILGVMVMLIIVAVLYPVYGLVGGGINLSPSSGAPNTSGQ